MRVTGEIITFIKKHYKKSIICNEMCDMVNAHFGITFTPNQIRHIEYNIGIRRENIRPLYSEKIMADGFTYIKISMTKPKRQAWKPKYRWVWEQAIGKIPKGMEIIFLDNNRQNCELENLAMVSRAEKVKLTQFGLRSENREITLAGIAIVKHSLAIHSRLNKMLGPEGHKQFINEASRKRVRGQVSASKKRTEPKIKREVRAGLIPYHFTPEQIEWIKKNAPGATYNSLTDTFNKNFGMTFTEQKIKKCCWRHAIKTGVRTQPGSSQGVNPQKGEKAV